MPSVLLSLPDELVGYIYSFLPKKGGQDSGQRRAFISCCKQVHNACRKQFSMLTIPAKQLRSSSSSSNSSNPFLCFPHNAQLKKLVLRGGHRMRSTLDPGNALVQFLQPARTEACLRVMSVLHDLEEVHFEGYLFNQGVSATVGTELCLHSQLRKVEIVTYDDKFAPFLTAFAAPGGKGMLQELHFTVESFGSDPVSAQAADESIKAISKLGSLRTLSLEFHGEDLDQRLPLSLISSLSYLTSLTICHVPCQELEEQSNFYSFLEHMPCLKKLSLPRLPREPVLAVLPRTIESIVDNSWRATENSEVSWYDIEHFCSAIHDIASFISHFPNLQTIYISSLLCDEMEMNTHKFASISQAMSALSHLHISLHDACGLDCLGSFVDFCLHTSAIALNITRIQLVTNEEERIAGTSAGNWEKLGALCPALQYLEINFCCNDSSWLGVDLECIYGARQLSSLQELRLVNQDGELKAGDMGSFTHKLLALAVNMSAKRGLPLMIVVNYRADWDEIEEKRNIRQAEIDQVQRDCASVCKALKSLDSEHCDVHLRFEAMESMVWML
mmetsp:Transcript_25696/g.69713  ORF Transcript_25696/g.69713 Transcript_25696/m.69713 type:complete len:558 (-) Transcript_25696:353-2026(-)